MLYITQKQFRLVLDGNGREHVWEGSKGKKRATTETRKKGQKDT